MTTEATREDWAALGADCEVRRGPWLTDPIYHAVAYRVIRPGAPKEEPMPKREPLTVHIGRVNQLIEYEATDGVTDVEVTVLVKGVGDDSALRATLGRTIAMAGTVDALVRIIGPSPEERAVIDAALQWVQAIPGSIAAQRLVAAVQALKEAK